jgi:hypothetical protein
MFRARSLACVGGNFIGLMAVGRGPAAEDCRRVETRLTAMEEDLERGAEAPHYRFNRRVNGAPKRLLKKPKAGSPRAKAREERQK